MMNSLQKITKEETLELRRKHIPACVQLFFKTDPLKIVKGEAQYLYDENGTRYLDCINNVAHVGHCHQWVVKCAHEQAALLETNSRFLHDNLVIYSKRLSAYLPSGLEKFFFCNSGSESNDLALRIARRVTGAYDVICLDHAYHGHLTSLIDISPYKFKLKSGDGQKEYVHVAPVPDIYRGKHNTSSGLNEDQLCDAYVQEIINLVENAERKGRRIAIFLAESFQSCGGQIIYPKNYLKKVYTYLHSKGILCLADEVQCGFYRSGTHMWGFQTHDVVPDFITLGKSMGNGHPVSCLVTTTELADKFGKDGLQYFNTYGGNPVSVAVANAVLDVIENEKLHEHVANVSEYLIKELYRLKEKYMMIGDIRGYGYFIGIDFVKCRKTREPATELASHILQKMREENILLSLDGPYVNVMKIKPPLPFNKENAKLLIEKLDKILYEFQMDNEQKLLITSLSDAVKECQIRFGGKKELATEIDSRVSCLISKLESLFLYGLKKIQKTSNDSFSYKQNLIKIPATVMSQIFDSQNQPQEAISFWPFLKLILNKHEINRFEMLKLVNTDSGRCRAWIRSCLNENSIEKQISIFISSKTNLSQYYEDWCLFLDEKYSQTLPMIFTGLKSVLFAINIDNANFNSPFKLLNDSQINKPKANQEATSTTALISSKVKDSSTRKSTTLKQVKTQVVIFDDDYEAQEIKEMHKSPAQRFLTNPIKIDPNKKDLLDADKNSLVSTTSSNNSLKEESSCDSHHILHVNGNDNQSLTSKTSDETAAESFQSSTKNPEEMITNEIRRNSKELNLNELREALMLIMNRKDELEETNRQLKSAIDEEKLKNDGLCDKITNLEKSYQSSLEHYKLKLQNFEQENQLLKDQLKKYISAVQLAKRSELNCVDGSSLEPIPSERETLKNDYSYEAEQYEKKLIQVAEMHGELIEFNTHLSKELHYKNQQLVKLTNELVQLRGPLPTDIQFNLNNPLDIVSLESDSLSMLNSPLINIWIPSVFLRNDEKNIKKTYHVYQVYIRINDEEWNVFRRFTEFYTFHQILKKKYPIVATLQLPKKKTIGNKDARFVQQRKADLQEYLRNVVNLLTQVDQDLSTKPCKSILVKTLPFLNDQNYETFSLSGLVSQQSSNSTQSRQLLNSEPMYDGL